MKKSLNPLLILLMIIFAPIALLYSAVGPVWFWIIVIVVACLVFYGLRWHKNKNLIKKYEEFQELVLLTIQRRIPFREWQNINLSLIKPDHRRAEVLRCIQILTESVDIFLASKNRDTIDSRFELVLKEWNTVRSKYPNLLSNENMMLLTEQVRIAEECYHTVRYSNVASAHIEKATTLKTEKSKQKYMSLAAEVLNEGITDPMSDKEELKRILARVPNYDFGGK